MRRDSRCTTSSIAIAATEAMAGPTSRPATDRSTVRANRQALTGERTHDDGILAPDASKAHLWERRHSALRALPGWAQGPRGTLTVA